MNFNNNLNNILEKIDCTAQELSKISGISNSLISRYRNGIAIPKYKSEQLESLIKSLAQIAQMKNINDTNENIIREKLESSFKKNEIDFIIFKNNFNTLISALNINVADMSRYIGYDPSYLSKIRSGVRKPSNIAKFIDYICKYVIKNYNNKELKSLINFTSDSNENNLYEKIFIWITTNTNSKEDYSVNNFLKKLDDFDLNNYIKGKNFDKVKVPSLPKILSKTKTYYGLEGFKKSQLDALKIIIFSRTKEDVFFYSNMSMIEASKDINFTKKFMIGLALILKKSLKLNIIHDIDRPFDELMLGLEGWIPLYMTGQIRPYYFKDNSNLLYSQIECSADCVALSGSYITNHINSAKLIVTNKKNEIEYYRKNAKLLLKKANSLMNIYNYNQKQEFYNLVNNNINIKGNRKNILTSLPCYTISFKLLNKILDENKIKSEDKNYIINKIKDKKNRIKKILQSNNVFDEINILSKTEFYESNYYLNLPNDFYSKKNINYSYENYLEHIDSIKNFKNNNKNYNYKFNKKNIFKNININIISDKQVIISKTNSPVTYFVIHHPKLIYAIQNFKPLELNK